MGPGGVRCEHWSVRGRRPEGSHGRFCSVDSETANVDATPRCQGLVLFFCLALAVLGRDSLAPFLVVARALPPPWDVRWRGFGQLPTSFAAEIGTVRAGQHWRQRAPAASNWIGAGGRAVETGERETGAATGTSRDATANGSLQAASQDTRAGFAHNTRRSARDGRRKKQ